MNMKKEKQSVTLAFVIFFFVYFGVEVFGFVFLFGGFLGFLAFCNPVKKRMRGKILNFLLSLLQVT